MIATAANLLVPDAHLVRRRVRVLCIDDDPTVLDSLARNLTYHGMRVFKAYNGMQGYWMACTEAPDVIVTDLSMPMCDGQFVLSCLKRNHLTRHIPVIVLTGLRYADTCDRVRRLGADHCFIKPTPSERIYWAIGRLTKQLRCRRRRAASRRSRDQALPADDLAPPAAG